MIRIALPNKGRLAEGTRSLLEQAGLEPDPQRSERALQAPLGGGLLGLFVRANDIPELVADGAADLGITGRDLVAESGRELEVALDLGFGRCRLAVAAREDAAIHSAADVPAGARVATSFPNLAGRYFRAHGNEVVLVPISGAAELAPHLGVADVIVDLVSTGSTLKVNGLREVDTVLESTAVLVDAPRLRRRGGPRAAGARADHRPLLGAGGQGQALPDGQRAARRACRPSARSCPASRGPPSSTCSTAAPWWRRTRSSTAATSTG